MFIYEKFTAVSDEELKRSRKQVQKEIKELYEQGVLVREGNNRNGKQICKGVFDDRNIKK